MDKLQKREIALDKFVSKWKSKKNVIGIIVCGSYVTGNPTEHSDIDIRIILDNNIKWRERWNEIIDGYLIEYFANPYNRELKYFQEDYDAKRKVDVHMYLTGKVLFDKTWDIDKLKKQAIKRKNKKYKPLTQIQVELMKYHIWDMRDNLEELYEADIQAFEFVLPQYFYSIFTDYSKFLWIDIVPEYRLKKYLTDKNYRKKYDFQDFPDKQFKDMILQLIQLYVNNEKMELFNKIVDHVFTKMWGFNIDWWKIRTKL